MSDFGCRTGDKIVYYEVVAIERPERFISTVKYFDSFDDAKKFCISLDYKMDYVKTNLTYKCELKIIKVTSEVL